MTKTKAVKVAGLPVLLFLDTQDHAHVHAEPRLAIVSQRRQRGFEPTRPHIQRGGPEGWTLRYYCKTRVIQASVYAYKYTRQACKIASVKVAMRMLHTLARSDLVDSSDLSDLV